MLVYSLDKRLCLVGIHFLTVISGIEDISIREHQPFHLTVVLTARTGLHLHCGSLGSQHIDQRQGGLVSLAVAGKQCRPICTHQLRHIREENALARHQLQGPHNGQVLEGSALHHNMFTQFTDILYFKYFIQTIFHNGIRETRSDVSHIGTLLHRLFHLRIHEHRAAGSQIVRMLGHARNAGKLGHRITQNIGEILNERAAA